MCDNIMRMRTHLCQPLLPAVGFRLRSGQNLTRVRPKSKFAWIAIAITVAIMVTIALNFGLTATGFWLDYSLNPVRLQLPASWSLAVTIWPDFARIVAMISSDSDQIKGEIQSNRSRAVRMRHGSNFAWFWSDSIWNPPAIELCRSPLSSGVGL